MGFAGVTNHDDFYELDMEEGEEDIITSETQFSITAAISQRYGIPHVKVGGLHPKLG